MIGATVAVGYGVATWVAFTMHGWWWPGRQLVVILPAAVAVIALAAERIAALRWVVLGSWIVGALGWVWLAVEASTGRRTLIVDFAETSNPWYQAWTTLLPDFQSFGGLASVALHWLWAIVLIAIAATAWRCCRRPGPAPHTPAGTSSAERCADGIDASRIP